MSDETRSHVLPLAGFLRGTETHQPRLRHVSDRVRLVPARPPREPDPDELAAVLADPRLTPACPPITRSQ